MFKVSSANRFESVVSFLSKKLKGLEGVDGAGGGVFCYVNSVFAPGLDEGVGGLWRVSRSLSIFSGCQGWGGEREKVMKGRGGDRGGWEDYGDGGGGFGSGLG